MKEEGGKVLDTQDVIMGEIGRFRHDVVLIKKEIEEFKREGMVVRRKRKFGGGFGKIVTVVYCDSGKVCFCEGVEVKRGCFKSIFLR